MNGPEDDRHGHPRSGSAARPFQFSLRAALSVITACCVVFGLFAAAGPQRSVQVALELFFLTVLAAPASQMNRGIAWLVGSAGMGLAGGLLLGAALVSNAYGPVDKQVAWGGFSFFAYVGPIAGGFAGLLFASSPRPVSIAGSAGAIAGLAIAIAALSLSGPREMYAVDGEIMLVVAAVVIGTCLGMIAGSTNEGSTAYRYMGMLLLCVMLVLGSCCLMPAVQR